MFFLSQGRNLCVCAEQEPAMSAWQGEGEEVFYKAPLIPKTKPPQYCWVWMLCSQLGLQGQQSEGSWTPPG